MICLSPLLQQWWRKAYFALEPYKKLPDGVRVRFRWLKRTTFTVNDKLETLAIDPRDCLVWHQEEGVIAMKDLVSGHPLLDGTLFDLTSDDPQKQVSFGLLQLQWDILRIAALSGAVEAVEDPSWNPDDDGLSE